MDVISDYVLTDLQLIFTGEIEGFKRMFKELFKNMAEENQDSSSGAKKRKLSDCVSKYKNYFNIESVEWQDDSFTLQCLNCPKKIKGNNRSASNFLTHYKNKHYASYSTMWARLKNLTRQHLSRQRQL